MGNFSLTYPSRSSSRLLSKYLSTSSIAVTRQAFFLCLTILLGFFFSKLSLSLTNHAAPNVEAAISVWKRAVVADAITHENKSFD